MRTCHCTISCFSEAGRPPLPQPAAAQCQSGWRHAISGTTKRYRAYIGMFQKPQESQLAHDAQRVLPNLEDPIDVLDGNLFVILRAAAPSPAWPQDTPASEANHLAGAQRRTALTTALPAVWSLPAPPREEGQPAGIQRPPVW
eukprot:COSAG02_NODE_1600_length_11742_cov_33.722838_4_plen_143_part_00